MKDTTARLKGDGSEKRKNNEGQDGDSKGMLRRHDEERQKEVLTQKELKLNKLRDDTEQDYIKTKTKIDNFKVKSSSLETKIDSHSDEIDDFKARITILSDDISDYSTNLLKKVKEDESNLQWSKKNEEYGGISTKYYDKIEEWEGKITKLNTYVEHANDFFKEIDDLSDMTKKEFKDINRDLEDMKQAPDANEHLPVMKQRLGQKEHKLNNIKETLHVLDSVELLESLESTLTEASLQFQNEQRNFSEIKQEYKNMEADFKMQKTEFGV